MSEVEELTAKLAEAEQTIASLKEELEEVSLL